MSAAQARRCRGAPLLNDLRVLIRRCRIKVAFNTSSDNGLELRVRHRSVTGVVASSSLGISDATTRTNSTGSRPRRCHQRWLAESLPCIAEIPKKLLTQFVA